MTTTTLGPTPRDGLRVPTTPTLRLPRVPAARLPRVSAEGLARGTVVLGSASAAALLTYMVAALPDRLLLSEYVHVPGGLVPFVGGLLALALAVFAAARLVQVRDAAAAAVLRVSGAAAVLAAAFPTDATRLALPSLSAQVHRYAALVVFVGLPLAGWLLARTAVGGSARLVRGLAALSAVAVVATLLLHPSSPVVPLLGHPGWEGIAQRAMAAADVALVGALAGGVRASHEADHIAW